MQRGIRHHIRAGGSPAMRILPADLLVIATSMLSQVVTAVATQLDILDDLARMHANLQHERTEFVDSVNRDLEGI